MISKREERRYRRISLNLPARIVVNAVDEYEGEVVNMSPGDLAVVCAGKAAQGDAVSVRIAGLDEVSGTVARVFPDGFAISFLLSKRRRALLTEQLMMRANARFTDGLEDRRTTPRHRDSKTRTVCRLSDGSSLYVKILDASVNGVSVDAPRRPSIGSEIYVGRRRGVVVRHTPRGFVVVYEAKDEEPAPALRVV